MSYPVSLEIDYIERRSRLMTFFRMLLAIPLFIVGYVYLIGLGLVAIVAWFVLLFTGRWPLGMYNFAAGALRFTARLNAYVLLAVDPYPPFGLAPDAAYPVRLIVDAPLPAYSRLKVFFRVIYVIPAYIAAEVLAFLAFLAAFASWFVIIVTGRQPEGLQNAIVFCVTYTMRAYALMYLVTETYPPFAP
ncbi:MAG TPA: DUF4389 domain-containing protein [Solirubrobacteraceae bacterium]|jgi:hypothetical protein|nr:DUF4389 domain-containing protein [Solirubrobacteraceae bacterium]